MSVVVRGSAADDEVRPGALCACAARHLLPSELGQVCVLVLAALVCFRVHLTKHVVIALAVADQVYRLHHSPG